MIYLSPLPPDNSNRYYALAQNLRRSINDMKIKIDAQLRTLAALKDRVRDQVTEMQRLEVECAWNLTLKKQGKDGVFLLQSKEEVLYM